ncbi:MAG: hypothetical protein ACQEP0_13815, partial [Natrinema limicola]
MSDRVRSVGVLAITLLMVTSMGIGFLTVVPEPATGGHAETTGNGHFTEGSGEKVYVNQSVTMNVDSSKTVGEAKVILENPHKGDTIEVDASANSNV